MNEAKDPVMAEIVVLERRIDEARAVQARCAAPLAAAVKRICAATTYYTIATVADFEAGHALQAKLKAEAALTVDENDRARAAIHSAQKSLSVIRRNRDCEATDRKRAIAR